MPPIDQTLISVQDKQLGYLEYPNFADQDSGLNLDRAN